MQNSEGELLGVSDHTKGLRREVTELAQNINNREISVLIQGPSGTGKELIARELYKQSGRNPFVALNCAAIPKELFESEMFGHERGAFTGANNLKKGKVELAERGILFLDEIGDLTPEHQAKILRFLQDKTFQRVGGLTDRKLNNIRIIAATNKDLKKEVAEDKFRADFYYRLSQYVLKTIPLNDRIVDIIFLTNYFSKTKKIKIDSKVKFILYCYDFPGNVRELKNLIEIADNYNYIERHIVDNFASRYGVDLERVHRFKSLYDLQDSIRDFIIRLHNYNAQKQITTEEKKFYEVLKSHNVRCFFEGIFFAKENDIIEIVEKYEIMTLLLVNDLSKDEISKILGIRNEKVYKIGIPHKKPLFSYEKPDKIYPNFVSFLTLKED